MVTMKTSRLPYATRRRPVLRRATPRKRTLFSTPIGRRRVKARKTVFSKAAIGEPVGSSYCKSFATFGTASIASRSLTQLSLTGVARGTAINQRLSDAINIRGFNIRALFRSNNTLVLNMAVVAVKDPDASGSVTVSDFFRSAGLNGLRSVDFADALSPVEFHMLPLNSDKFTVLKHDRWNMYPTGSGVSEYLKGIDWYVPLNRQVAYDDATTSSCKDAIHIIWWCDQPTAAPASAPVAAQCNVQVMATTHFKEVNS